MIKKKKFFFVMKCVLAIKCVMTIKGVKTL